MNRTRKLPDGSTTNDVELYVSGWSNLGDMAARRFGPTYRAVQCNPGVVLRCQDRGTVVRLSTQAALDLIRTSELVPKRTR